MKTSYKVIVVLVAILFGTIGGFIGYKKGCHIKDEKIERERCRAQISIIEDVMDKLFRSTGEFVYNTYWLHLANGEAVNALDSNRSAYYVLSEAVNNTAQNLEMLSEWKANIILSMPSDRHGGLVSYSSRELYIQPIWEIADSIYRSRYGTMDSSIVNWHFMPDSYENGITICK